MNIPEKPLLQVIAEVRYWEDARINGVEDTEGTLIPFRSGDAWMPVIDLNEGRILDWPPVEADIHYKVCDAGQYLLLDQNRTPYRTIQRRLRPRPTTLSRRQGLRGLHHP